MKIPPDAIDAFMISARTRWSFSAMGLQRPAFPLLTEVLFQVCQNDDDRFRLATEQLDAAFAAGWKAGQAADREALLATALANLLPEVLAEIEQRKTGGNAEDWERLEQLANDAERALAGSI
jgi:hypothetical protein